MTGTQFTTRPLTLNARTVEQFITAHPNEAKQCMDGLTDGLIENIKCGEAHIHGNSDIGFEIVEVK